MKKFRDLWKPTLVVAGVISGGAAMAQPYVTVPVGANISIVAPGAGTPGLNQIGNGGIVCMVDPDPVGGNFSIAGVTSPVWNLLGDISVNTASVPPTPPVTSFAGLTCGIETYNKNVRTPAEITAPEVNSHARSMGRVTINYTIAPCNNTFTFYIFKKWGNPATTTAGNNYAPPIVGPNCWGTGLINFQVDQVSSDNPLDAIGFDQYYWTFTNGASATLGSAAFYTSADRSAIVVDQGAAAFTTWLAGGAPYTIKCCFGRCNPWDGGADSDVIQNTVGVTCVTKVINAAAVAPTFTTPIPSCLLYSATSFSAVFTGVVGHTYNWTSTCGWAITQTGTVPGPMTLNVTGVNQGPCTLILTDVGPCGSNVYQYTVNRTFNNTLVPTLTSGTTCTAPGGTFQIALPVAAQGNCVNWTISPVPVPAWPFTDVNVNLHSIRTYTIPVGTCAGAYTITGANCSCPGNTASITMNVQPLAPTLSGPTCVPYNVSTPLQVYNASTPCGTLSYVWANTLGMTGTSTTSSISYAPVGTAGGLVKVNAIGTNGCTGPATSINVNRTPPAPVVVIPCVNVGLAGTATFSVSPVIPGMCYTWSFPATFCTPTAPTGSSVVVNTLGNTVGSPFACSVTVNNCSAPFCGPVTTNFNATVAYTTAVGVTNAGGFSTVNATPGQSCYQLWNCTTNTPVGACVPGNSFNLTTPGAGSFSVNITTLSGCIERPACVSTTFHSPLQNGDNGASGTMDARSMLDDGSGVIVSPNPNNGRFSIDVLTKVEDASATLYDASGQQVGKTKRLSSGSNKLGDEDLAPGIYTVRILVNGELITRQVAVTRE